MKTNIINLAAWFIVAGFILHLVFLFRIIREVNNSKKYSKDRISYFSLIFPFNLGKILTRHKEIAPESDLLKLFRMNNIVITAVVIIGFIYVSMN